MYIFTDYYGHEVKLSFSDHPFSIDPKHVLVICRFQGKWLLTNHKYRGLEFPGGKVEENETAIQGAVREVQEETGGLIQEITYIGQYLVEGLHPLIKNIYFAQIKEIEVQPHYHETMGPVLLEQLPENLKNDKQFSFIMKDDLMFHALNYVKTLPNFHKT